MKKLLFFRVVFFCIISFSAKIMTMSLDEQLDLRLQVRDLINRNLDKIVTVKDAEENLLKVKREQEQKLKNIKTSERLSAYLEMFEKLYRQEIVDRKLKSWIDSLSKRAIPAFQNPQPVEIYVNLFKKDLNIPEDGVYAPLIDAYKDLLLANQRGVKPASPWNPSSIDEFFQNNAEKVKELKARILQSSGDKKKAVEDFIQELIRKEFKKMKIVPFHADFILFFEDVIIPALMTKFPHLSYREVEKYENFVKNAWNIEKKEIETVLPIALMPSEYVELRSSTPSSALKSSLASDLRSSSSGKRVIVSPEKNVVVEIPEPELSENVKNSIKFFVDREIQKLDRAWQELQSKKDVVQQQKIIDYLYEEMTDFRRKLEKEKKLKRSKDLLKNYVNDIVQQKLKQVWNIQI